MKTELLRTISLKTAIWKATFLTHDSATVQKAVEALERADLLIVGGTSLAVYPAAALLQYYQGGPIVVINKSATPLDHRADLLIQEGIGGVLGAVVVR